MGLSSSLVLTRIPPGLVTLDPFLCHYDPENHVKVKQTWVKLAYNLGEDPNFNPVPVQPDTESSQTHPRHIQFLDTR